MCTLKRLRLVQLQRASVVVLVVISSLIELCLLVLDARGLCVTMTPHSRPTRRLTRWKGRRWINTEAANIAEKQENANKVKFTALFWGQRETKTTWSISNSHTWNKILNIHHVVTQIPCMQSTNWSHINGTMMAHIKQTKKNCRTKYTPYPPKQKTKTKKKTQTYFSCSRVLWSRFRRGFPVRSSSWSFGGRFSGRVISLSSLQLRSTHWQQQRADVNTRTNAHALQSQGIKDMHYCPWLTFISISCMTSGKTSMALEWAMSVCIRRQFIMVVGTVFSMLPLRSTSSSSSSLAILLKDQREQ